MRRSQSPDRHGPEYDPIWSDFMLTWKYRGTLSDYLVRERGTAYPELSAQSFELISWE